MKRQWEWVSGKGVFLGDLVRRVRLASVRGSSGVRGWRGGGADGVW